MKATSLSKVPTIQIKNHFQQSTCVLFAATRPFTSPKHRVEAQHNAAEAPRGLKHESKQPIDRKMTACGPVGNRRRTQAQPHILPPALTGCGAAERTKWLGGKSFGLKLIPHTPRRPYISFIHLISSAISKLVRSI